MTAEDPPPRRLSMRRDLPGGECLELTEEIVVAYARQVWKAAVETKCTDAIGVILENKSMASQARPRVMTVGQTTPRGRAAVLATILANHLRDDKTDDWRLKAAHAILNSYVLSPPIEKPDDGSVRDAALEEAADVIEKREMAHEKLGRCKCCSLGARAIRKLKGKS